MLIRLIPLLLVATITTVSTTNSEEGDAPYSHRRLYGIRRLRMLRPIPATVEHSPTHRFVDRRRQPAKLASESEEQVFVPRAQVPPSYHSAPSSASQEELPTTYIVQTANRFGNSLDDARKKRIEARWKRLGINFKTVNYPHHNEESTENVHKYQIRQLNVPKKADKTVEVERHFTQQPILHVINPIDQGFQQPSIEAAQPLPTPADLPPSGDYHSRTKPVYRGVKFVQEKLSVRPRLRIRRPGEKIEEALPEDPNLTPFMNNARAKFGYGTTTAAPISTTTIYIPPTTASRRPTTTTTTTETPIDFGDSGGDSGAGFGFGPAELPPEFQNVGFGVGGGDNGFNFNVPTEEKKEKPTEAPKTTETPTRRVVQSKTTTEAPIDFGEPGGDSGAGFGFGPSELPAEFQNVGFGVGGGDNGFNFKVPTEVKAPTTTEKPTTTSKPTRRVVQSTTTTEAPIDFGEPGGDSGAGFGFGPSELPAEFQNVGFGVGGGDNGFNFKVPIEVKAASTTEKPTATKDRRVVQSKTTTETPIDFGESGGDSGAGFGFGPSELPAEFQNVGFGVGGGDNGFNFKVPTEVKAASTTENPTTTNARRVVQSTTTTEAPIDFGDSGGDSGAGFGFGPSELPAEFQNVGFGVGGGDNGFNFKVPSEVKAPTITEKPTTTRKPTRRVVKSTTTTETPIDFGEPGGDSGAGFGFGPSELPAEFQNVGFGVGGGDNGFNFKVPSEVKAPTITEKPTTTRKPTRRVVQSTTTGAPIDFGEPGGDSGAGFGFGPSELPAEFQNVGFGVGGGDNGFNFKVPTEVKAPTTTEKPTTTRRPTRRVVQSKTTTEAPTDFGDSGGDSGAGFGFGPSELPAEFQNVGFGVGGGDNGFNFNVPTEEKTTTTTEKPKPTTTKPVRRVVQRKQPNAGFDKDEPAVIPQNSGLRAVQPPKEFGGAGGFGSFGAGPIGGFGDSGAGFGDSGAGFGAPPGPDPDFMPAGPPARPATNNAEGPSETDFFTGDSALTPSRGPTGDGYGPPVIQGGAAPPPVPSVGLGGAAAGKAPYLGAEELGVTENPATTVKPSALLSVLNKADMGFNQAIEHFEHGTPVETAAIDILEVALGSQKLDSQAKLLGHVDRTFGLDNLQRLQRWANTAGAMEVFKDQFVKFAKNFQPAADLLPTVPPQLEYLFKTSGK